MKKRTLISSSLIALLLFIIILLFVLLNNNVSFIDKSVNSLIPFIQTSFLVEFSKLIGIIFDTKVLLVITLLLALYLWFKKDKRNSIFLLVSMFIGAAAIYLLKEIVQRARPLNSIIAETGFGFPSGHSTIALIFFGSLIYIFSDKIKSLNIRKSFITLCVLAIPIIGLSRLILNVHWLTDILAGFCLGAFILLVTLFLKESI